MTNEIYYKKADAMRAAQEHQRLFGGWMAKTTRDHRTNFNFEDERMSQMCWSGEVAAVAVYGCRGGMNGVFAWWEE